MPNKTVTSTQQAQISDALFNLLLASRDFDEPGVCLLTACMLYTESMSEPSPDKAKITRKLARRIYDSCCALDDGRFTIFDFADAICNYPTAMKFEDLLNLPDADFNNLMLFIARAKRATYSEDPMPIDDDMATRTLADLAKKAKST